MDKTLDLRVQKTYHALIEAFFIIVQEKPLDKFTVNELCEKAQVRRPTFYKHFTDKYDFIKFVIHTTPKETLLEIDNEVSTEKPVDYFLISFEKVLDLVEQYQKFLLNLKLGSLNEFPFEFISDYLEKQLKERLAYFLEQDPKLPQDTEFTCQILLGVFRQVALWWLKNEETISKKEATFKMKQFLLLLFPSQTPE